MTSSASEYFCVYNQGQILCVSSFYFWYLQISKKGQDHSDFDFIQLH